jgi:stage III sporulation protein AH
MNGGYFMKTWKKNMVAAAVLVTVCAGIYLNWLYTDAEQTSDLTDTLYSEKILSEDMLVLSGDAAMDAAGEELDSEVSLSDYFAAVRLSRQEARDSAVTLLQEAFAYNEGSDAEQTNDKLEALIETALTEAQIESLIMAKGYTDCVAYMSEEGISVAVAAPEGGLKQEDVAVITDIVLTQSDYEVADIRVVEVQ